MDQYRFYDHGWEAAARGEPMPSFASRDWRDGWLDFHTASDYDKHLAQQEAGAKPQGE